MLREVTGDWEEGEVLLPAGGEEDTQAGRVQPRVGPESVVLWDLVSSLLLTST